MLKNIAKTDWQTKGRFWLTISPILAVAFLTTVIPGVRNLHPAIRFSLYALASTLFIHFHRRFRLASMPLLTLMLCGFFVVVGASLCLSLGPRESLFSDFLVEIHILFAQVFLFLFLIYCALHYTQTRLFKTRRLDASGYFLLGAFWTCFLSGTATEMPQFSRGQLFHNVVAVHNLLFWALLLALAVHYAIMVREDKSRRAGSQPKKATRIGRRPFAVSLAIAAALLIGFYLNAAGGLSRKPEFKISCLSTLPENYGQPFGEGPFLPSNAALIQGALAEPSPLLEGNLSCGNSAGNGYCHSDVRYQWEASAHRFSRNLFVRKTMMLLKDEKGIAALRYCAGCHDPIALMTGEVSEANPGYPPDDDGKGISCIACHSITPDKGGRGTGGYLFRLPSYRSLFHMNSSFNHVPFNLDLHRRELLDPSIKETANYCAACHTHIIPKHISETLAGVTVTDKPGDWAASAFNTGARDERRTCKDCHMPPNYGGIDNIMVSDQRDPTYYEIIDKNTPPGAIANLRANHRCLSGNTGIAYLNPVPPHYKDEPPLPSQLDLDRQFIKNDRVALEILSLRVVDQRTAELKLRLTNTGVGHRFPAGPPDLEEVWLHVSVSAASGMVVYESGALNDSLRLQPDAYSFKKTYLDANGTRLVRHDFWKIAKIEGREELQPGEMDEPTFLLPAHSLHDGPFTVRAQLRRRRFNPDYLEWAYSGRTPPTLPIADIAEAEKLLELSEQASQ